MKVVINACYGGFNLSMKAVKRVAELMGKECYFFNVDFKDLKSIHTPISINDERNLLWSAYTIPNPDEYLKSKDWNDMTQEEKDAHNKRHEDVEISNRDYERHDPTLIQVVEELGEEASGDCAKLKIVEIPDGVNYEIAEYDGFEHVAEKHRSWS